MSDSPPVVRSVLMRGATPREVYDVVTDFESYPKLFKEMKASRIIERRDKHVVVELRAEVVLAVRYVLDLVCDPEVPQVDWTFVEGEVVTDSHGGWRFAGEGDGTRVEYRASLTVKAPLPGFLVRKATDALVSASVPAMFAAIEQEVARRRATRGSG